MRSIYLLGFSLWPVSAYATIIVSVDLGTAQSFAVLAGSTVTNTGASNLFGNLGVWPGTAITGFPPGIVLGGTTHAGDATAMQAQSDLTTAYNSAASAPCGTVLTGQDLGGLTLTPGAYCFASSAQLTGTLTLNGQGDPNAVFLFQIGSTLTTAESSSVIFVNSGQGNRVFWKVGSSATLGTTTAFAGNILALTSITLNTGANIQCGRALALNGAVTMDTNGVDTGGCEATIGGAPEPGTATLVSMGLLLSLLIYRRQSRKQAT
jgi:type VI secretion system secreted protein VgrG